MNMIKSTIFATTMCLASGVALASDEDRSGFLLGVAFGASSGGVSTAAAGTEIDRSVPTDSEGGAFTLKVGGALSNKSALYFLIQGASGEDEQTHALTGLGAAYYFNKSGTSLYLNGGVGIGSVSYADEEVSANTGVAGTVGLGLELGMGLSLEVNYLRVMTEYDASAENPGPSLDYDIATTQFMLGYTWF